MKWLKLIEANRNALVPGALEVLEIHRQERAFTSRNKKDGISILEGISKYKGTSKGMVPISELTHTKKRGFSKRPSRRSWK